MKKILSTVAALGLVAGYAAVASAADAAAPAGIELTTKGYYLLQGKNIANAENGSSYGGVKLAEDTTSTPGGIDSNGADGSSRSWLEHDFRLFPTLKVNDKVSFNADVRLANSKVWGGSDSTDNSTGVVTTTSTGEYSTSTTTTGYAENRISVHRIYMDYMSPIGKVRVGEVDAGAWGGPYMNSVAGGYRIMYWPNFVPAPFDMLFFTQKASESFTSVSGAKLLPENDQDQDAYYAGIGYKLAQGKLDLAYYGVRSASGYNTANPPALTNSGLGSTLAHNIWFNANLTFSPVNVYSEILYRGGESTSFNTSTNSVIDNDAWAGILMLSGKATDALTLSGAYFFATGDDAATTNDNEAYMTSATGTGKDFEPLYIMTGDDMGVLNPDGPTARVNTVGVQAFGVFADFAATPALTLHAGIGTGKADEKPTSYLDDDFGWEYDLGASYKLLDNLVYDLHFGFWDVGDFVKGSSSSAQPNEVTVLTNSLKMSF